MLSDSLQITDPRVEGLRMYPKQNDESPTEEICLLINGKWEFFTAELIFGNHNSDS